MSKQSFKTASILVFSFFIITGCQVIEPVQQASDYIYGKAQLEQKKAADKTLATVQCQQLCQDVAFNENKDFTTGPCLSNSIIPGWVCDIAHSPRQDIDNDPANQCDSFLSGIATHYVEVDGNCNVIKAD